MRNIRNIRNIFDLRNFRNFRNLFLKPLHQISALVWLCTLPIWDTAQGTVAKRDTPCQGLTNRDTLLGGVVTADTPQKTLSFLCIFQSFLVPL